MPGQSALHSAQIRPSDCGARSCLGGRVREPPVDVSDSAVLAAVREHWSAEIDGVEHLPVGFGAHHWSASVRGRPVYFLTLDALGPHHDAVSLEAAYAAASVLMFPLDFVVAPVPSAGGSLTVSFGGRRALGDGLGRGQQPRAGRPDGRARHAASPARRLATGRATEVDDDHAAIASRRPGRARAPPVGRRSLRRTGPFGDPRAGSTRSPSGPRPTTPWPSWPTAGTGWSPTASPASTT